MPLRVITMPAASPSGKGRHPSLIISPLGSGKVGLARADRHLRVLDVDVDPMRFAIEHRGRKPQEILVVQLLGHALEGRREIVGVRQLEVTAAGLRRDLDESWIRLIGYSPA